MSDEQTPMTSLPVEPEDLRDFVFPEGTFEFEISGCEIGVNPPDAKFDQNKPYVRFKYTCIDASELNGQTLWPFSLTRGPGRFNSWFRSMGVDTNKAFSVIPEDWIGRKVKIRLSTEMYNDKTGERRQRNKLEEIRPND